MEIARKHVGERDAKRTTDEVEVRGASASVTITFHSLRDDSVRDEEHVVRLEQTDDNRWKPVSDVVRYRCWPGRGHQEFSSELCS